MSNRCVLRRDRKTATEGAEVTCSGSRLFQTRAAATRKARSPTVDSRVRLTISDEDELERSRWRALTSATWQSSSIRYEGADPRRNCRFVNQDCTLESDPLRSLQPMELTQEQSDVVELWKMRRWAANNCCGKLPTGQASFPSLKQGR